MDATRRWRLATALLEAAPRSEYTPEEIDTRYKQEALEIESLLLDSVGRGLTEEKLTPQESWLDALLAVQEKYGGMEKRDLYPKWKRIYERFTGIPLKAKDQIFWS